MAKFLIFVTAIVAFVVEGQTPKLRGRKPDSSSVGKIDPPKIEAPKIEAPKVEVPKLDPGKLDPAKLEPPKLEPPKLTPPKVDPRSLPMPASFDLKEAQGGPLRMPVPDASKVVSAPSPAVLNERSTLSRKAVILNDAKCPVLIQELEATPVGGKEWRMVLNGVIRTRSPITAADIRLASFDLFGNHMSTLQKLVVEDIGADDLSLITGPIGSTSEKEVKVLHTTFAFVAQVRLADGSVWKYDPLDVARALYKLQIRVDPGRLEATEK